MTKQWEKEFDDLDCGFWDIPGDAERIKQYISENFIHKSELKQRIGVLRQIINEDFRGRLIDNPDIAKILLLDDDMKSGLMSNEDIKKITKLTKGE